MKDIFINDLRIQILSHNLIRIEKKHNDKFIDDNTFFIPNRNSYSGYKYKLNKDKKFNIISFNQYKLYIPTNSDYSKIHLIDANGKTIYRFKNIQNTGELPKVNQTPVVFALNDSPHIIIPSKGYSIESFNNNEEYQVLENEFDMYLFIIEKDYKLLRRMYVELTGRVDLVRLQTLGLWHSRYYKYHDYEVKEMIDKFAQYQIPLDNFVIDTDWRKANDIGIGYEIDTNLFPCMEDVFKYAHSKNVAIMFNDHPEPFEKTHNVFDYEEINFREKNLKKILALGLDTWWYDRNWSAKIISPTPRIESETMGLYLFNDITKQHYLNRDGQYHTRPETMGNVNNILNGYYIRIHDSASHRYAFQWTGDISSESSSITNETYNLINGSENEITYINFDVGGHIGNPDKELYLDWIKFASFTPVMRIHCSNNVLRYREPWNYDDETVDIFRNYVNIRYRLLGYLYSCAFNNYETGEPIFKSLSYNYPNIKRLNDINNVYLYGNNLLIAPKGENASSILKEKHYASKVKATYFDGITLSGNPIATKTYNSLNFIWNRIKPEKEVPVYNFSAIFETKIKFDNNAKLFIRNDDGVRVYVDGNLVTDDWNCHGITENFICNCEKNKTYNLKIEYFQQGGDAGIQLAYAYTNNNQSITLPNDNWIDAFTGKIYNKLNLPSYTNKVNEFPVFIKEGTLLYLLKTKQNTAELTYDNLILEYYPSKKINDSGYIYEDDKKTIAYKEGIYRKTSYNTYYDKDKKSYNIVISPTKGKFNNEIKTRDILFKYYLLNKSEKVLKILVNNKEVKYQLINQNPKAYPFNEDMDSPISNTIVFNKRISIHKKYEIKIFIK